MTLDEWTTATCERRRVTDERYMQAAFNVLWELRPDLSEQVRGVSGLDPFYVHDDSPTADAFFEWVAEHWLDNQPPDVIR